MAPSRCLVVAVLLLALPTCVAGGRSPAVARKIPEDLLPRSVHADPEQWRKGGYIPEPFVGTWKCVQRNHSTSFDGQVTLGEPVKKHGTIAYTGHQLWMIFNHYKDKLFTSVDNLIWWVEMPQANGDPAWSTKYHRMLFEKSESTIPDPTSQYVCATVTIKNSLHMDILGKRGLEDCEAPTSIDDADFISHCSKVVIPWNDGWQGLDEHPDAAMRMVHEQGALNVI